MITDAKFVDVWQRAESPQQVENETGLSKKAIYARAKRYRDKGIPLKYFRVRTSLAKLIELAENTN